MLAIKLIMTLIIKLIIKFLKKGGGGNMFTTILLHSSLNLIRLKYIKKNCELMIDVRFWK